MSQEQLHRPEAASEDSTLMNEEVLQQAPEAMSEDSKLAYEKEPQEQPFSSVDDLEVKPEAASEDPKLVSEEKPQVEPITSADDSKISEEPAATPVPSVHNEGVHGSPPITYGDVFPAAAEDEDLSSEPITTEDASLMQTAEALAFGHTLKDGAASAMQSAAAKNVQQGSVEKDAHSKLSESGFGVSEMSVPGATMDVEYAGGHPIYASGHPTPTYPAIAALDAVTIGEAMEATAVGVGDSPVEDSDARAVESAEARATGHATPMKGGVGATAQSAAQWNHRASTGMKTTLADVLMDATGDLPSDKVVTYEDAYRVLNAELRGRNVEDLRPGGVGATLLVAADLNEQAGLIAPMPETIADSFGRADSEADKKDFDEDESLKYHPLDSTLSENLTKQSGTTEEKTPLVQESEQVPSHGSEQLPAHKLPEINGN